MGVHNQQQPPKRGIVLPGTAVLTSNLIFAIACLMGLRASFKVTPPGLYVEFLIFLGMVALSNYALWGLPEVIIRYAGERGAQHVRFLVFLRRALVLAVPSSLALGLVSLFIYAIAPGSSYARTGGVWALTIVPQSCLILARAYLEVHFHQLLSSIINGIVKAVLYWSPVLAVTFRLSPVVFGLVYLAALCLALIATVAHPLFRCEFHRAKATLDLQMPRLRAGLGINGVGALSVLGPLLDRIIATRSISVTAAIEVAIVSELCARFAIVYGTMGQFLFPHLALRVTRFHRSFRRLVSLSVLLYLVGVGILAMVVLSIEKGYSPWILPEWTRIKLASLIALVVIVAATGVSSLLMRPLFLLRREWKLLTGLVFTVSTTAVTMILFADTAVIILTLMGLRAIIDLAIYSGLYVSIGTTGGAGRT